MDSVSINNFMVFLNFAELSFRGSMQSAKNPKIMRLENLALYIRSR